MTGEVSEAEFMYNQQTREIDNNPQTFMADQMREDKTANILQQINPDNLLSDIEHRIRGEKKDFNGEWVPISATAEPVNEEMVGEFISFLGSILNQNTAMSNFSPKEINNLMNLVTDWISQHLIVNAKRYGIEGQYSEYDRIAHMLLGPIFAVLKRSQNGRESARIFKMMKVNESNSAAKKKGGFGENFKFW